MKYLLIPGVIVVAALFTLGFYEVWSGNYWMGLFDVLLGSVLVAAFWALTAHDPWQ